MECPSLERIASGAMSHEERGEWLDHAATCETCRAIANTLPTPAPVRPPTIGRFVPTREIGRGAMGVVYAADDPELGRPIALKLLHDASDDARLHREARALARLAHDNVVRVYDVGVDGDRVWVAMELVEGVTLRTWLATPRSLDARLAALLAAGRGLAAAHAVGIVHRDFKPDNIFVGDTRVVVGDFGLSSIGAHVGAQPPDARILDSDSDDRLTRTGAAVGTPAYMAPEQVAGEATAASDQFAFCVTVWEALFGVRPFHGATLGELRAASLQGFFTRPANRAIPRRIERALRRGLAAAPTDRFPSMTELLAALAPPRRARWVAAAALATVAAGAGVAYVVVDRPHDPCELAGAAIFDVWTTDARARVVEARGPDAAAAIDDYARTWQAARTSACRQRTDATRRGARDICFERARVELASQLDALPPLAELRAHLLPVETCAADVALPKTPGYELDARGCGCPYSACTDDHVCLSECNARAFRPAGKVPGINAPHGQDVLLGASRDATVLLYLSGEDCARDHLFLARRRGDTYVPVELTAALAGHRMTPFEGCCTLAPDGRSILVAHRDRPGLVRFPIIGDTLGPSDDRELAGLMPDADATDRLLWPVLSADQRALYFVVYDASRGGPYEAHRADVTGPFATATRMTGRASLYETVSGISDDGLTLFMTTEFSTSVLVREHLAAPFGDLGIGKPPARLPGWRAIPIDHCRRIITTMTPGGCASEDTVFLEAIGP